MAGESRAAYRGGKQDGQKIDSLIPGTPDPGQPPARYFAQDEEAKARGLLQVLGADGSFDAAFVAELDARLAVELYRGMVRLRVADRRLLALQRQGRIGFYGAAYGQEAAAVGSAAAMRNEDWLVPALREAGAGLFRGMPLSSYIDQLFGNARDVCKGRQMPCHPSHRDSHYVAMSSCVASQVPHAVGIAWAMKIQGHHGKVCVGYLGDGATSEEDFHVAANFAGVAGAPVVLICQNNQWAISTPTGTQTASETLAVKGLGYGIESLRADGNDVLAVYAASKYACDKARRGGGPTFIELLTYRLGAHSSSDDPTRYRDESVTEAWKTGRDPIARMGALLAKMDWLRAGQSDEMEDLINQEISDIIESCEKVPAPDLDTLITDVYEHPPWTLRQQLAEHLAHRGRSLHHPRSAGRTRDEPIR